MDSLPVEIIDKILFPIYYKCNKKLTLNEKICLSLSLEKQNTISKQINSLVKEFNYQRNRSNYNMWRKTKHPSYIFILYRCLAKKNKEHTLNLNHYNNFSTSLFLHQYTNLFNYPFINITHTTHTTHTDNDIYIPNIPIDIMTRNIQ